MIRRLITRPRQSSWTGAVASYITMDSDMKHMDCELPCNSIIALSAPLYDIEKDLIFSATLLFASEGKVQESGKAFMAAARFTPNANSLMNIGVWLMRRNELDDVTPFLFFLSRPLLSLSSLRLIAMMLITGRDQHAESPCLGQKRQGDFDGRGVLGQPCAAPRLARQG